MSGSGLKDKALRLLAQREHSRAEMGRKLSNPAADVDELAALLDHLQETGLLSDERFAASYVRAHAARYGAARLLHGLKEKGVAEEVALAALGEELEGVEFGDELERARAVWSKKFGEAPADAREWARQARFLQGRGFSVEVVKNILKEQR